MWLKKITEWFDRGVPCAMITVIKAEGSVPRGLGSKMVVNRQGEIAGSVGGGELEHISKQAAIKCIEQDRCASLDFSLNGEEWKTTDDHETQGICGGSLTVFIEPIIPRPEIVIFGGGHIGEKLSKFCEILNLPYRVFDSREEFASAERFPSAIERVCKPYETLDESIQLTRSSYCIIVTHGHAHDQSCLEQILRNREVPYIGMIGSNKKVETILKNLRSRGALVDQRVYAPVGIRIGGRLPEEIALSIIAEMVLVMNGGSLDHSRVTL
ncbi:MAG: XdhC family protein [Deltaproteobacteria bacterium]|nr:XdhC family protein [Deltaproteobacteria bacterium]